MKHLASTRTTTSVADNNITVHLIAQSLSQNRDGVFTTQELLGELIGKVGKRLIENWNLLTGVTPVKKFASTKVGVASVCEVLQGSEEKVDPAFQSEAAQRPGVGSEEPPASKKTNMAKKAPTSTPAAKRCAQGSKTATILELRKARAESPRRN